MSKIRKGSLNGTLPERLCRKGFVKDEFLPRDAL